MKITKGHSQAHFALWGIAIKIFKPHMISLFVAVLFVISAYFFLTAYNRYVYDQAKLKILSRQVGLLNRSKSELENKKRILAKVEDFVKQANSLGLQRDKWDSYDVSIQEPVSFPDAEKILTQAANSASYYFKPITLHIKTNKGSDKKKSTGRRAPPASDSQEDNGKDILLTLQGAFLVKKR